MSKPKILVIDDNPSDVHLLQLALGGKNCEFEIEIATDGEAAIQVVLDQSEADWIPCVIVLDMHLPKYDGVQVLEKIRQSPGMRYVKVVVTTTSISPSYMNAIQSFGASYYPKPDDLSEFEALARHVLDLCRNFKPGLLATAIF